MSSENNEILAFDQFNQKLIFTPSRIATEIQGLVNNGAGYPIGASKLVVDDLTAGESLNILKGDYLTIGNHTGAINKVAGYTSSDKSFEVDGFSATESDAIEVGDYLSFKTEVTLHKVVEVTKVAGVITALKTLTACGISLADDDVIKVYKNQPYRIEYLDSTAGAITTIGIYPPLKEAVSDGDIILIGGGHIKIDLGMIGEEATKLAHSLSGSEQKNAMGVVVDGRDWYDSIKFSAPIITISKENYLLLVPGAFMTMDATVSGAYQMGIKGGIYKRLKGQLLVKAIDDEDNVYKTLIIPVATVKLPSFETGGKDKYLSFALEFDAGPDANEKLYYIGKEDAAW